MSKIPLIDENDLNALIEEALKGGGVLATPKETSQMLIQMRGISINSKPRKDGRYQGYIEDNGKHYVYGRTKEEVAIKIKEYLKNGIPKKKEKKKKATPVLREWLKTWMELYKRPNVKPKTLYSIEQSAKIIGKELGDLRLDELTSDKIQAFLVSMDKERTRDLCRTYLAQALKKAVPSYIKFNPCDGVEIKKHKSKHKNALTPEEQTELLQAVQNKPLEPLFRLLLTTGIRIGEALALTRSDLDVDLNKVNITKNVVFIEGKRIAQETTKSEAGTRSVPVPQDVLAFFKEKDGELFPMSYNAVRMAFRKLSEKTGINVTPHILRHTYATRLEEAGISPKVKQYLLGHSTLEMTQNTYTDVQKGYIDTLSKKILSVFDTKK